MPPISKDRQLPACTTFFPLSKGASTPPGKYLSKPEGLSVQLPTLPKTGCLTTQLQSQTGQPAQSWIYLVGCSNRLRIRTGKMPREHKKGAPPPVCPRRTHNCHCNKSI